MISEIRWLHKVGLEPIDHGAYWSPRTKEYCNRRYAFKKKHPWIYWILHRYKYL